MPLPLIETVCDDFSDGVFDTSLWQLAGGSPTAVESGGELEFQPRLRTLDTDPAFDARSSNVTWAVDLHYPLANGTIPIAAADAWEFNLLLSTGASFTAAAANEIVELRLYFDFGNFDVFAEYWYGPSFTYVSGPSLTVTDATKHGFVWWRVSDTGSSVLIEYSEDDVTWTTFWDITGRRAPGGMGLFPEWQAGGGTTLRLTQVGTCSPAPAVRRRTWVAVIG